jgi:hypothetical protein
VAASIAHAITSVNGHGDLFTVGLLDFIYAAGAYLRTFSAAKAFVGVNVFYVCGGPFIAGFGLCLVISSVIGNIAAVPHIFTLVFL